MKSQERERWIEALKLEHDALVALDAWEVVKREDWMPVIGSMTVLKEKRSRGRIEKLKARIVARGDQQMVGVNCGDTFAPTARLTTTRLLVSSAVNNGWDVETSDVSTAFINAKLNSDVFMRLPEGIHVDTQSVC